MTITAKFYPRLIKKQKYALLNKAKDKNGEQNSLSHAQF